LIGDEAFTSLIAQVFAQANDAFDLNGPRWLPMILKEQAQQPEFIISLAQFEWLLHLASIAEWPPSRKAHAESTGSDRLRLVIRDLALNPTLQIQQSEFSLWPWFQEHFDSSNDRPQEKPQMLFLFRSQPEQTQPVVREATIEDAAVVEALLERGVCTKSELVEDLETHHGHDCDSDLFWSVQIKELLKKGVLVHATRMD